MHGGRHGGLQNKMRVGDITASFHERAPTGVQRGYSMKVRHGNAGSQRNLVAC